MNNGLILKKMVLREIKKILREQSDFESFEDEPEDNSEDDEDESKIPLGIDYDDKIYTPRQFVKLLGLTVSDPETSLQQIYDESGGDIVRRAAKNSTGNKVHLYCAVHPFDNAELGADNEYACILLVRNSKSEIEDVVAQYEQEV